MHKWRGDMSPFNPGHWLKTWKSSYLSIPMSVRYAFPPAAQK